MIAITKTNDYITFINELIQKHFRINILFIIPNICYPYYIESLKNHFLIDLKNNDKIVEESIKSTRHLFCIPDTKLIKKNIKLFISNYESLIVIINPDSIKNVTKKLFDKKYNIHYITDHYFDINNVKIQFIKNSLMNIDYNLHSILIENNLILEYKVKCSPIIKCINTLVQYIIEDSDDLNKELIINSINGIKICENEIDNKKDKICVICLTEYNTITFPVLLECCKRIYCVKCIFQWYFFNKENCPNCRTELTIFNFIFIYNSTKNTLIDSIGMFKHDKLKILLLRKNNKTLIYTQSENNYILLKKFLIFSKIDYKELKGSNINNIKKYDTMNDYTISLLLLNPEYYGNGLIMKYTKTLIFYDVPIQQTSKRLITQNQMSGLNVYYFS